MPELLTVAGPLEPDRLSWVAELYGAVDGRYRRPDYLAHLFAAGPLGPALHAFALAEGEPVAHCAVVPMRARRARGAFRCGKVEALVVAESHRGRRTGEQPVVLTLLDGLFAFAYEQGIELLHAFVREEVGRVFRGFAALGTGEPTLVGVTNAGTLATATMRRKGALLGVGQRVLAAPVSALGRSARASLRQATGDDADLAETPGPPPAGWTVAGEDAWEWYCSSPFVRVLEISGPHGCRALVQLPGAPGDPLRLASWRPERPGLRSALLLTAAAAQIARGAGASTVRFQPWRGQIGDGSLGRACRLLGFVRRSDFTTLYVQSPGAPELARAEAVQSTPFLYLGF